MSGTRKPRLLDLFCKAGGAARGYQRAGFYVVGVDIEPQPRFAGDEFIQADALTFPLDGFDAIHASPPCQAFTNAQKIRGREHPDLIDPIRQRLIANGKPWVIENVPGAPLYRPIELCGSMFGLKVYRHRLFEASFSWPLLRPACQHEQPQIKMGRPVEDGDVIQVVGHFSNVRYARKAMGIEWMSRDELAEAIPPAYTEWVGQHLIGYLRQRAVA